MITFEEVTLMPSPEMSDNQRLSCILRFIVLVTFLLYIFVTKRQDWIWFLLVSIGSTYAIWYSYGFIQNCGKTPLRSDK